MLLSTQRTCLTRRRGFCRVSAFIAENVWSRSFMVRDRHASIVWSKMRVSFV